MHASRTLGRSLTPKQWSRQVFTGWKVVATSASLWALQSMLWMQGFGNIAVELRSQFGWSKTLFSVAFGVTRAGSAFMAPAQGAALSKWGTKLVMRFGSIFVLGGFVGLALIQTRLHFFIAFSVAAFGMALAGFLTITSALVPWFERKRARALSIQTMGFAIGGFAGPLLVFSFEWIGWRQSLVLAGAILTIAIYAASSILGRSREETGEPVDGVPAEVAARTPRAEGVSDDHFTARQALRTRSFWMVSMGHSSALVVVSAVIAHIALYLVEDRGFSARNAALIAGAIPVFQFIGTALGGYLGDRMNKRVIIVIAMFAHGVGLLVVTWFDTSIAIGVFVVLHGLAWGSRGPQMQAIRADYFGTTHFATIMGWSSIIVMVGTVAGPLLAGILADSTGDYRVGFTIIAIVAFVGNIFWFLASPPTPINAEQKRTGVLLDN